MMGCDNSDYSYCVSNFPGPGVTEVLEEPVEEESEGEVSDIGGLCCSYREGRGAFMTDCRVQVLIGQNERLLINLVPPGN